MVVFCSGLILARFFSGTLEILLGFELGYLLGFNIFLFRCSLEGKDDICILRPILELPKAIQSFLISNVEI